MCNDDILTGLKAFIEVPFVQGNIDIPLRWGVLTDGRIKITTAIKNYCDANITFEIGQSITAYGKVFEYKEKPAFELLHVNDLRKNDSGQKDPIELKNVVKTPKKPG
ncbi:hypothetical protein QAD02_016566 [Eretmocerus hayati]|uniref:Uncharacterized protein n=1 Tax=Eretmocerus hayati TaxID=131215 RepID=A0ACC2PDY8_9HYME|nr:hypothetical protein QAD02_016566 [Eretmocerus hayati]